MRVITKGPKYHWFGYYDKLEFDPTDRYVWAWRSTSNTANPRPTTKIPVGMVDLQDDDRWIELGLDESLVLAAGMHVAMGSRTKSEVIWNDRENGTIRKPNS